MKRTVVNGVIGIAALACTFFAGRRILRQVHRGRDGHLHIVLGQPGARGLPGRSPFPGISVRPVPEATEARPDPIRVIGWSVKTQPALVAPDCPRITQAYQIQYRTVPKLIPSVIVHVGILVEGPPVTRQVQVSNRANAPGVWPGLRNLELLRADTPGGSFRTVQTHSKKQMDGLRCPVYSQPIQAPLYRYDFSLIDRDLPSGRVVRYKVRFTAAGTPGTVPAESGGCTAVAFDLPAAKLVLDSRGRPCLEWNAANDSIPALLEHPKLVAGLTSTYDAGTVRTPHFLELGRADVGKGRLELPREMVNPGFSTPLAYAVEGIWNALAWSSFEGSAPQGVRTALSRPVTTHAPTVKLPSHHDTGGRFVFRPHQGAYSLPAGGRVPDNRGLDISLAIPRGSPRPVVRVQAAEDRSPRELAPDRNGRWIQAPGPAVRLEFTTDIAATSGKTTLLCATVRPPYPTGFRALPGNGRVRLTWDPLLYSPADWIEAPEFVVRRALADGARVVPGRWVNYKNPSPFRVIYRGPASTTEVVDRNVKNGHLYFYSLTVEGVARATGALSGDRSCSFDLPMAVGYRPGGSAIPNVAVPHAPRPVRLAVVNFDQSNLGVEFLRRALAERLGQEPWARLVERTEAPSLRREEQLADLGTAGTDSGPGGPGRIAADAVLFVSSERIGTVRNLAVWWEDYRNAFSRRLVQTSVQNIDLGKTAAEVVSRVKDELGKEAIREALSARVMAPAENKQKHVVAIIGLAPLSLSGGGAGIPAKALADLLGVALGASNRWRTVDREHVDAALAELGRSAGLSAEDPLRLGRLLGADIVLQGWYTSIGRRLAVSLQPLDVGRGTHLPTVAVTGSLDAPDEVMAAAAKHLERLTTPPVGPPSHPLLLALESQVTTSGFNQTRTLKRRSYVTGDTPDELFQLGNRLAASSQVNEALNAYRRGFDMALRSPGRSPMPGLLAQAMDRIFARENRGDERLRLWRRLLAHYEKQGDAMDAVDTHLHLADVLLERGDKDGASKELLHVRTPSPHSTGHIAAILERLGRRDEALAQYLKADWFLHTVDSRPNKRSRLGPAYAAAIRYLRAAQGETRKQLLAAIVRNLCEIHPIQALKAFAELRKEAPPPPALRTFVWRTLKSLHDAKRLREFADSLLETPPATLEDIRLLNEVARYYLQLGDPERAARFARKAMKAGLKTPAANVQKKLARKYIDQKNRGQASRGAQPKSAMPSRPVVDEALREYVRSGGGRQFGRIGVDDVYVLTENGFVLRLSPDAGQVRWACSLEYRSPFPRRARGPSERKALLHNMNSGFWLMPDTVYAVNIPDGILFAIDAGTGRIRWRYADWTFLSPPVFLYKKDKVAVANAFGELLLFAAKNGQLLLRAPGPPRVTDTFSDKYVDLQTNYPQDRFYVSFNAFPGVFGQRNTEALRDANAVRLHRQGLSPVFPPKGDYYFEAPAMKVHEITGGSRPPTFADLARKLRDKTNPDRRELILVAQLHGANRQVTDALTAICRDPTEPRDLRQQALRALASRLGDAAPVLLMQALGSSKLGLQTTAAQEMHTISPQNVEMLADALRNASGNARGALVSVLIDLAGIWAKPALKDILANPKDPLYGTVVAALAEAGDPDMLGPLRRLRYVQQWLSRPTDRNICTLAAFGEPAAQAEVRQRIDLDGLLRDARAARTVTKKRAVAAKAKKALGWIRNCLPDPAYLPAVQELAGLLRDEKGRCLIDHEVRWAFLAFNRPESIPLLLRMRQRAVESGLAPQWRFAVVHDPLAIATGVDFASDVCSWETWWRRRHPER